MKPITAQRQQGEFIPVLAFDNESTVMALIEGLTAVGLDYNYYQVADVAATIDEQFEIAQSIIRDEGTSADVSSYLITNDWAIEMLNEKVWSENAPDLDDYPQLTFNLPRVSNRRTASLDPTTVSGVTELLERAGLSKFHYFLNDIADRAREYIRGEKETERDGGISTPLDAETFFEWVYEADKAPETEPSYGPDLYANNPGIGWSPIWTP